MKKVRYLVSIRIIPLVLILIFAILLFAGCSPDTDTGVQTPLPTPTASVTPPPDGEKAASISYVYTTQKAFSLIFSGSAGSDQMEQILDKLDEYGMKAVFFQTGMRVAEEPDLANEIIARGHELGNGTLSGADLTALGSYGEIYDEISKANAVIQERTGTAPKYLNTKGGQSNDNILIAAKACGLDLVTYFINLQTWNEKSGREIEDYLMEKVTRGSVIALNTENTQTALDSIDLIARTAGKIGYSVKPLTELLASQYERKPLEQIAGWDTASPDAETEDVQYNLMYTGSRDKKEVALTFDDWGTDLSVNRILDILEKYGIKATFFLRGNGVELNPNLAMAIAQAGHDVANHTYAHPVITQIPPEKLQEEIVRCHRVLTEAIQREPDMMFRPPTGELDESSAKAIAACGYPIISMYDLSPHDWDVSNSAEDIVNYVKQNVQNGSIILLHLQAELDTYKALPVMIEFLKEEGYEIVPMSQMLQAGDVELYHSIPVW